MYRAFSYILSDDGNSCNMNSTMVAKKMAQLALLTALLLLIATITSAQIKVVGE
jgi:hypothetical protein